MFNFKPKLRLRKQTDQRLLAQIDAAKKHWLWLKQTETQDIDVDPLLINQVKLQRAKYDFLFVEARHRGTHATNLQEGITRRL